MADAAIFLLGPAGRGVTAFDESGDSMATKKKAPDLNSLKFKTLKLAFKAGIATVWLNRPKAMNAMSITMREELGDILFVMANIARHLGMDAETCLRHANDKFSRRFNAMEAAFEAQGKSMKGLPLEEMESGWIAVKVAERK